MVSLKILETASDDVKELGKSVRSVAKLHGHDFVERGRCSSEEKGSIELPRVGYHIGKKVFTEEQEKELAEYLL